MENQTQEVVNNTGEQTPSPSTSDINTSRATQASSYQSREDINTQEDQEQGERGNGEYSEKSINRFQELANENRELREALTRSQQEQEAWLESRQEMERRLSQYQANGDVSAMLEILQGKQILTELDLTMAKEEKKWQEAFASYPELKQDRELDDQVYAVYMAERQFNPNITPKQVADKIVGFINRQVKKAQEKGYEEAENEISEKIANNVTQARKAQTLNAREAKARKNAYQRLSEGDESVLSDLLNY
jgi:hypothetical protein